MCFRRYYARKVLRQLRWDKKFKDFCLNHAARTIQKWYFQMIGSWEQLQALRREAELRARRERGANLIQRVFRGYLHRKRIRLQLREMVVRNKAALIIQKVFRSCRVLWYQDMKINRRAAEIYDMQDMELEISASRVGEIRAKTLASIQIKEGSSDSEDDMADEDEAWVEYWDSQQNRPYYFNALLNESAYEIPESKNAFHMSLINMTAKVSWPAMGQWYEGTITRYNKSKKKHRIEYSDGDHEWINLRDEHDRIQLYIGETWIMFDMYEPEVS